MLHIKDSLKGADIAIPVALGVVLPALRFPQAIHPVEVKSKDGGSGDIERGFLLGHGSMLRGSWMLVVCWPVPRSSRAMRLRLRTVTTWALRQPPW